MNPDNKIITILIAGLITLYFFPEPETYFFSYIGIAISFVLIITVLLFGRKNCDN